MRLPFLQPRLTRAFPSTHDQAAYAACRKAAALRLHPIAANFRWLEDMTSQSFLSWDVIGLADFKMWLCRIPFLRLGAYLCPAHRYGDTRPMYPAGLGVIQ